jgi:UDP:flavonoid glycosyltransferase YjiC (YdhE family)
MGRIVFAWELGGGLGHIQRILPLADELQSRGHEVVCVMKNVAEAEKLLGGYCSTILQAPVWPAVKNPLPDTVNYAETLFNHGYLINGKLLSMVKEWRRIFESTTPDLIIADHSPTALVAARGTEAKVILYGTGFESPPRLSPMPSLIPWVKIPVKLMQYSEDKCLQAINTVLTQLEAPLLNELRDLFEVDADILGTFQELDHFQTREPVKYWGVVLNMLSGEQPSWPNITGRKKIFAYLKPSYPDFDQVLRDLQQIDAAIIVYAPDLTTEQKSAYQSANLRFSGKPLDIHRVCKETDLIVCHAGHGTVCTALLYGKPLVLLPENRELEQVLTALNVLKINVGKVIYSTDKTKDYRSVVERVVSDDQYSRHARNFAEKYENFSPEIQIAGIADICEDILAR